MIMSVAVSAPVYINYLVTTGWFFFHASLEAPLVLCTRQKCYQNVSLSLEHEPCAKQGRQPSYPDPICFDVVNIISYYIL